MWIERLIKSLDRKKAKISFDSHALDRIGYWNLDFEKVKETVRVGSILMNKCERPNKVCFRNYFGKENLTYIIVVRYCKDFIRVKTIWSRKGR